jgi:hypothetical protein
VPSYWIVDPVEPSLLALDLTEKGAYEEVGRGGGHEPMTPNARFRSG